MTIGILEVQAAAAVTVIDDAALASAGIGPVGQALVPDAAEGSVELLVADGENLSSGLGWPEGGEDLWRERASEPHHRLVP